MKTTAKNFVARVACLLLLLVARTHAADRDYVEDSDYSKTVSIAFNGTAATVVNGAGVSVTYGANASYIAINSAVEGVEYVLSGTSADGYVQITSTYPSKVTLNGVSLTSSNGPAVSLLSAARNFVVLAEGSTNSLADGATYTRSGSAALYASGPLILSGRGGLTAAGNKSHGIQSTAYLRVLGGDVQVTGAPKDALHAKTFFQMDAGTLTATATGDGIDADSGYLVVNGGEINVKSTVDDTKGLVCDGALTINGGLINLTVNGVQSKAISNKADLAINGGTLVLNLAGGVYLESVTSGTTTYTDPSYSAGIKCGGNLTVAGGTTTITHTGTAGKGINVDGNVLISGGTLDLATSGGVSASYTNESGAADYASADCLTTDGTLTVTGGTITTLSTGDAGDGLSADLAMNLTGGTFNLTNKGARSKGIAGKGDVTIGGGNFTFAMSGAVVLETVGTTTAKNPNYCTALKCDGNLNVTNGTLAITHTGLAGKGISVDKAVTISGGTLNITTSGGPSATFTNTSNVTDIAASDCLKTDGALTITGGTVTAVSTGIAGDAISCDGAAIIGVAGVTATPVISATTSGARVLVSGQNYANSKAFSAGGNLTMNGGSYTGKTSTTGAEGLESKANLTINGGTVEITAYDDGINASTSITINGGNIYSYASNNDGIDSNGTIKITGGTIVASGAAAPEEGFDCDNNNFTITGGTMVGTGGAGSTPTASTSTQNAIIYKGTGTANAFLVVKNSSGTPVHVYKMARSFSGTTGMLMLISNASLPNGTYTIVTGATVTGGTVAKTFTVSARVTTVQ